MRDIRSTSATLMKKRKLIAAYIAYCFLVLSANNPVLAVYNPGNICATCVDICDNIGTAVACNGTACDRNAVAQTCRGLYRSTTSPAVDIMGCIKQDPDTPGGNFITCSETVMRDPERDCYKSIYCDCEDNGGDDECIEKGGSVYKDSNDCDGKIHPMPVLSSEV